MPFSTLQLEQLLERRVLWNGNSHSFDTYVVGRCRTVNIRVRGDKISDVMDRPFSIEEIKAVTDR